MTSTTTAEITNRREPSDRLQTAIHSVVGNFQKTGASIQEAFAIGREEGFTDMEIGNMIRKEMLAVGYDPRTIRRALPSTAKHIEKRNKDHTDADILSASESANKDVTNDKKLDKMSGSERKPLEVPADKVKVEPTNKALPSPEERTVEGIENDPLVDHQQIDYASDSQQLHSPTIESKPQIQQPGPKEVQDIRNINPTQYKIEDLYKYDKYLLIEIVEYLDDACNAIDKEVRELNGEYQEIKEENETLRSQLDSVKPFVELFSALPSEARDSWLQFMKNALERE